MGGINMELLLPACNNVPCQDSGKRNKERPTHLKHSFDIKSENKIEENVLQSSSNDS